MSLKICYDDEIHKISKLPLSILDLRNKISSVFRDTLPTNYRLEYLDTDGDRIVISNNTAYRELIDQGLPSGGKPLKIYVAYFNPNRKREKGNEKVSGENQQKTGPIHIQNKEEFAEDLPKPDRSDMGRSGDAPSDESLPSSDEDHEEKVHEIYESVEELKKGGNVELHPEIYDDPDSEKELKKVGRKERKVENRGEKEQEKMRKLMDQIRDKDLSEEKKEKAVKKLIKYKESLAEKQTSERQVRQAREKEARSRLTDPLELVISQVLQNMMPDITRMVGEHGSQGRVERSGGRGQVRQAQNKVTHPRIICDGCSMRPITGVRYKCTVCPNFDYCEDCEENMGHPHPFIKINTPQQDYFSHGFFADHINRRHHHQLRVGSESEKFHHDAFEPFHGYGPMWAPRIMHTQRQEPVQREQRVQKEQREPREEREREQREQKEQLEREQREVRKQKEREQREQREREKREREQRDQREQREQREKREQKEQKVQETEKEKPGVQKATKVQKSQKKEREQKPRVDSWEKVQGDEREKENYASQTRKTDRSTDVEIEDETHLIRDAERYNVIKEGKELRERQNQNWVPSKEEDLKDLEKEKKTKVTQKEHLGDVKAKASKLKKEFPNTKFDTLIRYVEEAPEDLTTEELVNNFLSWK